METTTHPVENMIKGAQKVGGKGSQLSKTRICIKNLPPKTTERDLKEYLSSTDINSNTRLHITDCKILKNDKGRSRKVGFVGLRSEEEARQCIRMFHHSFLNMTRITVEPALARKDSENFFSSTNPSTKCTHSERKKNVIGRNDIVQDVGSLKTVTMTSDSNDKQDKAVELLDLMRANSKKSKFWANDDGVDVSNAVTHDMMSKHQENVCNNQYPSLDNAGCKDKNCSKFDPEDRTKVTDLIFLRSKQMDVEDLEDEISGKVDNDEKSSSSSTEEILPGNERESIAKNTVVVQSSDTEEELGFAGETAGDIDGTPPFSESRLFVRNLPFDSTEEELVDYFSPFGRLVECHIPVDDKKRNKGYAFVTFDTPADAREAKSQLDQVDFQGRLLHIIIARLPHTKGGKEDAPKLSWKQKQEISRKEDETRTAGKSSQGWSASFVRGDAVLDNLAERLGLRKEEFLGIKDGLSSGDAAVRLALGETQIIEENRQYFLDHGVNMDILVSANLSTEEEELIQRSKTAILVKNLPFDTRLEELTKLFHVVDVPVQVLLPPSRTIALVEFKHSVDAKKAFRKLAYRRFKHVPIFLEWAPLDARIDSQTMEAKRAIDETADQTQNFTIVPGQNEGVRNINTEEQLDEAATATLYVKNLNFATTEESLWTIFDDAIGGVVSVRIPRKIPPSKSAMTTEPRATSIGYGFVEFSSRELAQNAVRRLQGKLVDGHTIELAISSQSSNILRNDSKLTYRGKKSPTKIMVRNVPFQASRQDLLKLFGAFGQLRKVRLPKKFDGNHRGFAFVEFLTGKEALAAMSTLSRTHLYGRHLVLEWASDEAENLDFLRNKAKRDAGGVSSQSQNKKIRFANN
ncbi:RRM domain containing RNA-binding protein [Nitzschia inconspicua]|uniref:RRM domain containing RNA-binding protein n=1 Tax=Nitzschia inconspicua TaxID=303405 RepID=A0A9K3KI23_9STRA|nr:RRM domain containing RNA-binding protein [Nitzschia inconspicua]